MRAIRAFFESIGQSVLSFFTALGGMMVLLFQTLVWGLRPPYRFSLFFIQAESIGVGSLFIVALTGLFTGMVFAEQSNYAFGLFGAEGLTGATVTLSLTRELAPVLTALMVTGRSGSAMTSELGTMRVTEQIDALTTMAVNPIQYLVVPRITASTLMVPALCMVFNVVGVMGAYGVSVVFGDQSAGTFIDRTRYLVDPIDIWSGAVKATVFGTVIALIACFRGFYASGGSKGVGLATTEAVVTASIAIFILDYFLTVLLLI
ncbi:MAG: ABC transporter permease [Deltaproteobacteria bacterium]|nr:ABC transporter permease [Deltaproteobacteria bacterium]